MDTCSPLYRSASEQRSERANRKNAKELLLFALRILIEDLSQSIGRISHELDAVLTPAFRIGVKILDHLPVLPIHSGNILTVGTAEGLGELFELFDQLEREKPHAWIFLFFKVGPTVKAGNKGHTTQQGSTNATAARYAAAKRTHGPNDPLVHFIQFLLPHSQNRLTAVESLVEKIYRLLSHFFRTHYNLPKFSSQGFEI